MTMPVDTWQCSSCGREVATRLNYCPTCGSNRAGVKPAEPQEQSRPSGSRRNGGHVEVGLTGWGYVGFGWLIALVGVAFIAGSQDQGGDLVGIVVLSIGSLLATIGAIAVGVRLGLAEWHQMRGPEL